MKCKRCGMETFRWMGRHICWGIADNGEEQYFTTAQAWPEVRAAAYHAEHSSRLAYEDE